MQKIADFFKRHKKVMFQLSAGKDSAAALWLLQDYWPHMDVVWCNAGNPYPETLELMTEWQKRLPNFCCVLGDQPNDVSANGWPVDVVPMESTQIGMMLTGQSTIKLRPFWECCGNNMWNPMQQEVIRGGYSGVIRGQKLCDKLKAPTRSGDVQQGVEYLFPIEDWTDEDVLEFLGEERLPGSYKRGMRSSLDCMNCTAFAAENPGRIADLKTIDERAWKEVSLVHLTLLTHLEMTMNALRRSHGNE